MVYPETHLGHSHGHTLTSEELGLVKTKPLIEYSEKELATALLDKLSRNDDVSDLAMQLTSYLDVYIARCDIFPTG